MLGESNRMKQLRLQVIVSHARLPRSFGHIEDCSIVNTQVQWEKNACGHGIAGRSGMYNRTQRAGGARRNDGTPCAARESHGSACWVSQPPRDGRGRCFSHVAQARATAESSGSITSPGWRSCARRWLSALRCKIHIKKRTGIEGSDRSERH